MIKATSTLCISLLALVSFGQNTDSLLKIADYTSNHIELSKIYNTLANKYLNINLDSASSFAAKMNYHAIKSKDPKILYDNYATLGNIYSDFGSSDKAIEYYRHALDLIPYKTSDLSNENIEILLRNIALINNIGISYYRNGDTQQSKMHFEKTINLFNDIPDNIQTPKMIADKASVLNNLSSIYMSEQSFDTALSYLFNALELANPDNPNVISIYNNIGICYLEKQEQLKSLHYLLLAQEKATLAKNKVFLVSIFNNLADFYLRKKEFNTALNYLEKSKNLEKNINLPHSRNLTLRFYSELYQAKGNFQLAFQQLKHHQALNDSLNSSQTSARIAQIEKQYALDKAKQDYLMKQEQLKASQKGKILLVSIIAILGVSIALFALLIFLLQRSKLKQANLERSHFKLKNEKLEQDLEFRNKELATNVMYMVRKNELINSISEKLLHLKFDLKKANQQPMQQIISELKREVDNEVWKEFELRFMEVHKDFYTRLNEKFPELTPNERKLCAFLKLNISTKEISAITFQSPESIRIARTRLRKKLNLTHSDQNLVEFLENI